MENYSELIKLKQIKFARKFLSKSKLLTQDEIKSVLKIKSKIIDYKTEKVFEMDEIYKLISNNNVKINTVSAVDLGEIVTLKAFGYKHSWSHDDYYLQFGTLLIGDVIFGSDFNIKFSRNGTLEEDTRIKKDPEFSLNKKQVVLIETWYSTTSNSDAHSNYEIYIYKSK